MSTLISRNDCVIVPQVSTLTPAAANASTYKAKINTKVSPAYTSDASGTVAEITAGSVAILAAIANIPEFQEVTWTDSVTLVTATGASTGEPFTVTDGAGTGTFTPATPTVSKSPNHWIAENFSGGVLPATNDDVVIQGLAKIQSIKWGLAQSAVVLTSLDIRADSQAEIGLPEIHGTGSTAYYEYRATHLAISATVLKIGDGIGQGSGRIKIDLGTNVCTATIYKTGNPADQDEGAVHLAGSNASNALQVFDGKVDIAMLPGYTSQWASIIASGGTVRCGTGVTLATVEAAGSSKVETRSAVTTLRTRDNGSVVHSGAGNITTADVAGGTLTIRATGTLTIGQLNGYAGKTLDLSQCDALVTVTASTIYASPGQPFTILDPNNKLVMTAAASTPNGAQSLVVVTGSGRNVRIT